VSFDQAERIKLGGAENKHSEDRLQEIFQSTVTDWIEEIKRALDYVGSLYPQEVIEKIFVGGGSCRIPGFQQLLEQETGTPVVELDPFASLKINEKRFDPNFLKYMGPQAAVAVGLALRSVGDK
jgi:type IV pilus assembly protein PilM